MPEPFRQCMWITKVAAFYRALISSYFRSSAAACPRFWLRSHVSCCWIAVALLSWSSASSSCSLLLWASSSIRQSWWHPGFPEVQSPLRSLGLVDGNCFEASGTICRRYPMQLVRMVSRPATWKKCSCSAAVEEHSISVVTWGIEISKKWGDVTLLKSFSFLMFPNTRTKPLKLCFKVNGPVRVPSLYILGNAMLSESTLLDKQQCLPRQQIRFPALALYSSSNLMHQRFRAIDRVAHSRHTQRTIVSSLCKGIIVLCDITLLQLYEVTSMFHFLTCAVADQCICLDECVYIITLSVAWKILKTFVFMRKLTCCTLATCIDVINVPPLLSPLILIQISSLESCLHATLWDRS